MHVDVEVDDGAAVPAVAGEPLPGGRGQHRAAAEGQHAVVPGERAGDRLLLQRPEVLLAGVDEQVGDRGAGGGLDVGVGVPERQTQRGRDRCPDRRLARGRRPHEGQGRAHR